MNKTGISKLVTASLLTLALLPGAASAQMPASVQAAVDSMNQQTMDNAINSMNQQVIDNAFAEQQAAEQAAAARKARWRKKHPPSAAVLRRERQAAAEAAYIERKQSREDAAQYEKDVAEYNRVNAENDAAQQRWSDNFAKEQRETDIVFAIGMGSILVLFGLFFVWFLNDLEKMNRQYGR